MILAHESLEKQLEITAERLSVNEEHYKYIEKNLGILRGYHEPTADHSIRVCLRSQRIAGHMNLSERTAFYGTVQDIGKLDIPLEILGKTDRFTDEDLEIMRNHATTGYERLMADGHVFSAWIALLHHKYQNGNSYPEKAPDFPTFMGSGTRFSIGLYSRLVSIADHHDALNRRNDKQGSIDLSDSEKKKLMHDLNPDQPDLIESLYKVGVLD